MTPPSDTPTDPSPDATTARRALGWALPEQIDLIRAVADRAGLTVTAVGGPSCDGNAELSRGLDAERVDDLRAGILRDDIDLIWLAATGPIEPGETRLLYERGLPVFTTVPHPVMPVEPARDAARMPMVVPLMRSSPLVRTVLELRESFGEIRLISIAMRCRPHDGAVAGRLFDAMDLLVHLGGRCEELTASLAAPAAETPEQLLDLGGDMAVHLRLADNMVASVSISDRSGGWLRGLTIIGDGGCIRATDDAFEWLDAAGEERDSSRRDPPCSVGELIGEQMDSVLALYSRPEPPTPVASVLAMCEAARLSCRTGSPESPTRVLEILARP